MSKARLLEVIQEILYMRAVMVYEIRYMGEDRLEAMKKNEDKQNKT